MLAPLARPIPEVIVDQQTHLAELDGTVTSAEERQLEQTRDQAEKIRTLDIGDDEVVLFGGDEYWRTYSEYDKFETARDLDVPLALYFGERDYQVTTEDELPVWREEIGDEPNVTIRTYDSLNHHFMAGSGQPTPWEYYRRTHVAERVVSDLATWIGDVTETGRS